jgi:hypothetical protein
MHAATSQQSSTNASESSEQKPLERPSEPMGYLHRLDILCKHEKKVFIGPIEESSRILAELYFPTVVQCTRPQIQYRIPLSDFTIRRRYVAEP